ncbi:MAG: GTPase HflX [Opitutales bacterium]|nr:GTPase HflX [Opitutales bacterium]
MFDVREKPQMVQRAYLIGVQEPKDSESATSQLLGELEELVETLHIGVIGKEIVRIREYQARFLVGPGKVEEVLERARAIEADCLVIDAELSPSQQRNWEAASGLCVIDRQEVILDIFHERAQTREAVLQVELARSEHSLPRLKNAWTHLSRQRGGGGVTQRGEGEAQIELDQRMVRQRISRLRKELTEVIQHRQVQRKQRMRVPIPSAAIVGYTNAGKSTLLNRLTGSSVLSEDKLFATLDPTTRQLALPDGQKVLLTDTVGFVRRLPHQLVEAFKATLEEAVVANLLIHVVDVSNPEMAEHQETTLRVLKELGAGDHRVFTVYNKIDAAGDLRIPEQPGKDVFYLSAHTGEGVDKLVSALSAAISETFGIYELLIPHSRYDLMNSLHERANIRSHKVEDEGVRVVCAVPPQLLGEIAPYIETEPN